MADTDAIEMRRMRTGSVFRIVAAGAFCSLIPFFILMGIFAFFGFNSLRWNDEPVYGFKALALSPLFGIFAASIATALAGAGFSFGLWVYSKFRTLILRYVPVASCGMAA